mgnify:CR=1 FL=1
MESLRKKILTASFEANACHIGSALSCVEIIESIFLMKNPEDFFIFSKASGVATLYCKLYPDKASEYLKKYPLPSREVPGVIWSGGSLGMGLSIACGLALSDRSKRVFCLISDGELQEGQTWEAIMFANHHKLNNLIVFVDRNGLQALGKTEDICKLEPLADKFKAFGWETIEMSGHFSPGSLGIKQCDKPLVFICHTTKGKGVDYMQDNNNWHYDNLNEARFKEAILQVSSGNGQKR